MKRIYCLTDAHLGESKDSYDEFFKAMDEIPKDEVFYFIVLGDFFKFFIGIEKWITKKQKEVLEKIYEIKKNGSCTIFIEGNRDFFLEKNVLNKYFNFIEEEIFINFNNKNFLFLHGDKINKKDKKYLFWNKFSKSSFLYFITKIFPKPLLMPFYLLLEKSLKGINLKYKENLPLQEIEGFLNSLDEKIDFLILGHFHKEYKVVSGKKEAILLPAFKDTKNLWYFEDGN